MVSISVLKDELSVSGDFHLVIPGLGTIHISIQYLLFFHVAFLVVTEVTVPKWLFQVGN